MKAMLIMNFSCSFCNFCSTSRSNRYQRSRSCKILGQPPGIRPPPKSTAPALTHAATPRKKVNKGSRLMYLFLQPLHRPLQRAQQLQHLLQPRGQQLRD